MTQNQLKYLELQETQRANRTSEQLVGQKQAEDARHNVATEAEAYRSNTARESETARSNKAREDETYRSNFAREQETLRHNTASLNEAIRSNLAKELETNRANIAREEETSRANRASEAQNVAALEETVRAHRNQEQLKQKELAEQLRNNIAVVSQQAYATTMRTADNIRDNSTKKELQSSQQRWQGTQHAYDRVIGGVNAGANVIKAIGQLLPW